MNRASRTRTAAPAVPAIGRAPVVGLTGGMGAGKSHLAAELARRGVEVIDADRLGHEALLDPAVHRQVLAEFGPDVSRADGSIDRSILGAIVFDDSARLHALESIVHPYIRQRILDRITSRADSQSPEFFLLDAAVLWEAGWDDLCDLVIFLDSPEELRHRRLESSRGWTADDIRRREAAQWPLERKRRLADLILGPAASASEVADSIRRSLSVATRRDLAAPLPDPH